MTIKGIICDFGGVLVRMEDESLRHQMADRLGLTLPEMMKALFTSEACQRASEGKITEDEYWQEVNKQFKFTDAEVTQFRDDIFRGEQLNQELLDLLQSLPTGFKKTSEAMPGRMPANSSPIPFTWTDTSNSWSYQLKRESRNRPMKSTCGPPSGWI